MLSRFLQKIFGENGPTGEFGQFGSDSAGGQITTKDPNKIQELDAYYGQGLFPATNNHQEPPRIEDINGLYFLFTRQLAYLFQAGIAEWQIDTEYFANKSLVLASNGGIYIAITGAAETPNKGLEPSTHSDNWKLLITKDGVASGNPPITRSISAGNGLSGGGDLSANRTLALDFETLTANIKMNGAASVGTTLKAARSDHIHPVDTSRAPINHASSGTTYGVGTASNYGHNKVVDILTRSSHAEGEAASSYAAYLLKTAIDLEASTRTTADTELTNSKAPTDHSTSEMKFGIGTRAFYGHNKVIDDLTKSSHVDGEAASSYAAHLLKAAADSEANTRATADTTLTNSKAPNYHASEGTTYGLGTTTRYGHNKIADDLDRSSYVAGEALSSYQGYILNNKIANLPIGFMYIQFRGCDSPSELGLPGTWTDLTANYANRYLAAAGSRFEHGVDYDDGLPNITGNLDLKTINPNDFNTAGAFTKAANGSGLNYNIGSNTYTKTMLYFNANNSNSIYGAANFVRPATTVIRIWQRTA